MIFKLTLATGPYSNFQVGATIFTHDGQYISGANIENASYPVALCAERVAFARAMVRVYMSILTFDDVGSHAPGLALA